MEGNNFSAYDKYLNVFKQMKQGFCIIEVLFDENGKAEDYRFLEVNPMFERQTGLVNAVGKTIRELEPAHEPHWFTLYGNIIQNQESVHLEQHAAHLAGGVWYDIFALPFGPSENNQVAIFFDDITYRKNAETLLRFSEQQQRDSLQLQVDDSAAELKAILDSSMYVMQAFKAVRNEAGQIVDFTWLFVNKRWKQLYGGEMKGKSMLQENPAVIETGLFEKFIHVTETGIAAEFDHYYAHEQFDAWFHQTHVKLGDGFLLTAIDITEAKKAEQELLRLKEEVAQKATDKYLSIFTSIDEGFCIYEVMYDANGKPVDLRWIEVNPAYEKQTGIKDVVGKLHSELSLQTEDCWLAKYDSVVKTGEAIHFEEWHAATGRWYSTYSSRIGAAEDHQVAVLFSDVTRRRAHEQGQQFLLAFSDTMRAKTGVEAVGNLAVQMMAAELKLDRVYLVTLNPYDDQVVVTHETRMPDMAPMKGIYRGSDFPSAIKEIFEHTIVYTDVETDPRLTELDRLSFAGLGAGGFIATSIRNGNQEMIWAAGGVSRQPRKWLPSEIALFEDAVERSWAAIERAKSEEMLQASEKKYRALFNSIDEGFYIMELIYNDAGKAVDYRFLEVNASFERHTGLHNAAGGYGSEISPNTENVWFDAYSRVVATGESIRFEDYNAFTDRWYSAFAFSFGDKQLNQVAVLFDDITDRKLAEQKQAFLLKLSDALNPLANAEEIRLVASTVLGRQLNANRVAYAEHLREEKCYEVNQNYVDNADEVVGRYRYADYGPDIMEQLQSGRIRIQPDIQNDHSLNEAEKTALARAQVGASLNVPLVKNGSLVAFLGVNYPTAHQFTPHEIEMVRETAERTWAAVERAKVEKALRESEESFRVITKAAMAFAWICSAPDGSNVFFNDQWYAYTGQSRDQAAGYGWTRAIHPEDWVRIAPYWTRCQQTGEVYEGETRYLRQDGVYRWFVFRALPRTNQQGEIQAWYGLSFDIDDKKKAEEAIRESEQQLRRLLVLRDEFIGIASHELKTPVTAIKAYAEVVQDRLEQLALPKEASILERLNGQIDRLTALISDLLDTTKVSEGNNNETFPGMGLGLYICAEIIKRHGGTLSVSSELGKGSVFSFTVPRHQNTTK